MFLVCSYAHWVNLYIVGVEARGFMFGPSIALAIGAKFVPLRQTQKVARYAIKILISIPNAT